MPSDGWQTLGKGDVLGHLRGDLKKAQHLVMIVGPWIDAFFAEAVVAALPAKVELRVTTRPATATSAPFAAHAAAAVQTLQRRPQTSVRTLATLHAKVVVVDERVVYCGSANWYRYSLEQSREIVLRGPLADVPGVLDELQVIWEQASIEAIAPVRPEPVVVHEGYQEEVLDPIAAAKLKAVPGSFVLSVPPKKR